MRMYAKLSEKTDIPWPACSNANEYINLSKVSGSEASKHFNVAFVIKVAVAKEYITTTEHYNTRNI